MVKYQRFGFVLLGIVTLVSVALSPLRSEAAKRGVETAAAVCADLEPAVRRQPLSKRREQYQLNAQHHRSDFTDAYDAMITGQRSGDYSALSKILERRQFQEHAAYRSISAAIVNRRYGALPGIFRNYASLEKFKSGYKEIHYAVMNADMPAIRAIVAEDPNQVYVQTLDGATVLQFIPIPNQSGEDSRSTVALIRFFLRRGVNPNITDRDGNTVLHRMAREIILPGIDRTSLLGKLADQHMITVAQALLSPSNYNAQNEQGNTPLLVALEIGNFVMAEFFIEQGADVHVMNNAGMQAIHLIAKAGQVRLLNKAIARGADPKAEAYNPRTRNGNGDQPMHYAAMMGHVDVINILWAQGASVNAQNLTGGTPLHNAVYFIKKRAAQALLALKARKNLRAKEDGFFGLKNYTPAQLARAEYAARLEHEGRQRLHLTTEQERDLRGIAAVLGITLE